MLPPFCLYSALLAFGVDVQVNIYPAWLIDSPNYKLVDRHACHTVLIDDCVPLALCVNLHHTQGFANPTTLHRLFHRFDSIACSWVMHLIGRPNRMATYAIKC